MLNILLSTTACNWLVFWLGLALIFVVMQFYAKERSTLRSAITFIVIICISCLISMLLTTGDYFFDIIAVYNATEPQLPDGIWLKRLGGGFDPDTYFENYRYYFYKFLQNLLVLQLFVLLTNIYAIIILPIIWICYSIYTLVTICAFFIYLTSGFFGSMFDVFLQLGYADMQQLMYTLLTMLFAFIVRFHIYASWRLVRRGVFYLCITDRYISVNFKKLYNNFIFIFKKLYSAFIFIFKNIVSKLNYTLSDANFILKFNTVLYIVLTLVNAQLRRNNVMSGFYNSQLITLYRLVRSFSRLSTKPINILKTIATELVNTIKILVDRLYVSKALSYLTVVTYLVITLLIVITIVMLLL